MKDAHYHLEQQLSKSTFRFGEYLEDGFDIWKKGLGPLVGFTACYFIIAVVLAFIPIFGQLASTFLISPVLLGGAYMYSHKLMEDERVDFGEFFNGFENAGQVMLSQLFVMIIGIGIIIPFIAFLAISIGMNNFMGAMDDPRGFADIFTPGVIAGVGLFALLAIYLSILVNYVIHFIFFYKLEAWDAIKYSVRYVHKHWFMVFFFMILVGLIVGLGVLAVFIGLLFTMPLMFTMSYASFRDLTDLPGYLDDETDESDVLDTLIS